MPYKFAVHHIDVGIGDSTLIVIKEAVSSEVRLSEERIIGSFLIDAGENEIAGNRVSVYSQRKLGEKDRVGRLRPDSVTLNALMISHFDRDHIGGLFAFAESGLITKDTIIYAPIPTSARKSQKGYKKLLKLFQKIKGIGKEDNPFVHITKGEIITDFAPLSIKCLEANRSVKGSTGSKTKGYSGNIKNQISLAFLFEYNGFNYYTGGDIGQAQEKAIAKILGANALTAFKVSHHGSHSSTPAELLNILRNPSVGVVSYGNNTHKLPHSDVLKRAIDSEHLRKLYFTGQLDQYGLSEIVNAQDEAGDYIPAPGNVVIRGSEDGCIVSYDRFDKSEYCNRLALFYAILSFVVGDRELAEEVLEKLQIASMEWTLELLENTNNEKYNFVDGFNRYFPDAEECDLSDLLNQCICIITTIPVSNWRHDTSIPENAFYEIVLSYIQHDLNQGTDNIVENRKGAGQVSQYIANHMGEESFDFKFYFHNTLRWLGKPDVSELWTRCETRLKQLQNVLTFERRTRTFHEGGFINKMTDIFEY